MVVGRASRETGFETLRSAAGAGSGDPRTAGHHFVGSLGHTTEPSTGGLIYMRARWYDPVTGRFVSEDPAGDGANWYGYCGGNPVNCVDPEGRSAIKAVQILRWALITLGFSVAGVDEIHDACPGLYHTAEMLAGYLAMAEAVTRMCEASALAGSYQNPANRLTAIAAAGVCGILAVALSDYAVHQLCYAILCVCDEHDQPHDEPSF